MEIYKAVCEFYPPNDDSDENNILSFAKGDRFEVLDSHKQNIEWWGARALKDNSVGYVPSKYLKYEERKIGKLSLENNDHKILREKSIKRLAAIRQSSEYKPPDEVYPDIPSPDYDGSSEEEEDCDNLSKNGSLGRHSAKSDDEIIEDVIPVLPEPDPDYLCEEDTLDSTALRAGRQDVTVIQVGYHPNHSGGVSDHHNNKMTSEAHYRLRNGSDCDEQGLIVPKKLRNPCLDSKEHLQLRQELLLNKKQNLNVLKKSELQKKLKDREELRRKKEREAYNASRRTSLEVALEERANKLKIQEEQNMKSITEESTTKSEFSKMHAKITTRAADN